MDVKTNKQWSVDEINCLLALWSSAEVQKKLDGASRTKPVLQQIQHEMAAGGPACQVTGALNSAAVILEGMVNHSLEQSHTDPELSAINDGDDNIELPQPLGCSSPSPSSSSSGDTCPSSSAQDKRDPLTCNPIELLFDVTESSVAREGDEDIC
ncbi:uncharacterized protein LOC113637542 [Tachysurus ichikawai]